MNHETPTPIRPLGAIREELLPLSGGFDPEEIRDALIARERRMANPVMVAVRAIGEPWAFYVHIPRVAQARGKSDSIRAA